MKKALSLLTLALVMITSTAKADEGMWLPMFVERLNYVDMQAMGLNLTPEEIYSINNSSLKDAIVGLGYGERPRGFFCTGEIVSDKGLLFTNHHCGYSSIQKLSTVEHDYLTDGFWAKNFSEELPAEGISASFLVRMEDMTKTIMDAVNDSMSYAERQKTIQALITELEGQYSEGGIYNAVIKSFFGGNEYYMFVYHVYTDIRLVGTPPSSIGKFGGDTDNWMWPRHTGDFSIFRVYGDSESFPAVYAQENKPIAPKHHLPISLDGVKRDDFTMIWGFPGSTQRYMSSFGIDYNIDNFYPIIVDIFGKQLEVMDEFMAKDQAVNIMYADNHAGLANTWKNFIGQIKMLRKNRVVETKTELEKEFENWVKENADRESEYGRALPNLKKNYRKLAEVTKFIYYPNFVASTGILSNAGLFTQYAMAAGSKDKEAVKKALDELKEVNIDELFKDQYKPLEDKTFAELLKLHKAAFTEAELPSIFELINKKYKGDIDAFAADVQKTSIFATPEKMKAFIEKPNPKKLSKDLAYMTYESMIEILISNMGDYRAANAQIAENDHIFIKGLREMYADRHPDKVLYPDANSTMRMSYGSVKDYMPSDAVYYNYICTANGILQKENPEDPEFIVPERLIELIKNKDFGRYADSTGNLVVCFLSTNDITGGNSGSPIMNGNGELIGLAFDGNWEAMSGDINFEPSLQRTINVDIRYVLLVIDKFAGATNLISELDIRQTTAN